MMEKGRRDGTELRKRRFYETKQLLKRVAQRRIVFILMGFIDIEQGIQTYGHKRGGRERMRSKDDR